MYFVPSECGQFLRLADSQLATWMLNDWLAHAVALGAETCVYRCRGCAWLWGFLTAWCGPAARVGRTGTWGALRAAISAVMKRPGEAAAAGARGV